MNRKIIHKDQYGIIRGTIALSLLLIFVMGLNMYLHSNRDTLAAEERASDATRQIAAQFQQLIEDSASQMAVASHYLNTGTSETIALESLSQNTSFLAAAILDQGNVTVSSGNINMQESVNKTVEHIYDNVRTSIIAQNDSSVQLRILLEDGRELAAWISPERINAVLSCAYTEEYGYAVFDRDTGLYLINQTHFSENTYFGGVFDRDESGSLLNNLTAQAYIAHDSAVTEPYYIAQMPTEIGTWSIALLIPENLIDFDEGLPTALYFIGLLTIAVSVLAVFFVGAFVYKKVKAVGKTMRNDTAMANQMTQMAASHGQLTVFQYDRKKDTFLHYLDRINMVKDETGIKNVAAFSEFWGLDSEGEDRIRAKFIEIKPDEEVEFNLQSQINDKERFLHIILQCSKDNKDIIAGCIMDCTQGVISQNRIVDENNFYTMMLPKSSSIWQVNVSKNTWRVKHCANIDVMRMLNIPDDNQRDYETDLNGGIREYLHPEDYAAYAEEMSINGIMSMYRKGVNEVVHEYRTRNAQKTDFEWHRQVVRVFQNPDTREILANIFIINVNAEKNAEMERRERTRMLQRSLTALGGIYRALFYVDLDNNICYTAKAPGGELVSKAKAPFREMFDAFVDRTVVAVERKAIKDFTSAYNLRKNLSETNHLQQREYHRISGDHIKRTMMVVQAARFENGTVRDVVIALRNVE